MSPRREASRGRAIALTGFVVFVSGVIGWSLIFAGLGAGLIVGLALMLALLVTVAFMHPRATPVVFGFAFAFFLLTWPVLWFVVGYVRYLITGEALED